MLKSYEINYLNLGETVTINTGSMEDAKMASMLYATLFLDKVRQDKPFEVVHIDIREKKE